MDSVWNLLSVRKLSQMALHAYRHPEEVQDQIFNEMIPYLQTFSNGVYQQGKVHLKQYSEKSSRSFLVLCVIFSILWILFWMAAFITFLVYWSITPSWRDIHQEYVVDLDYRAAEPSFEVNPHKLWSGSYDIFVQVVLPETPQNEIHGISCLELTMFSKFRRFISKDTDGEDELDGGGNNGGVRTVVTSGFRDDECEFNRTKCVCVDVCVFLVACFLLKSPWSSVKKCDHRKSSGAKKRRKHHGKHTLVKVHLFLVISGLFGPSVFFIMLNHRSSLLKVMSTFYYSFPLIWGYKRLEQSKLLIFARNWQSQREIKSAVVTLYGKTLQIISVFLVFQRNLFGLPYYFFHFPVRTFAAVTFVIFVWLCVSAVTLALICWKIHLERKKREEAKRRWERLPTAMMSFRDHARDPLRSPYESEQASPYLRATRQFTNLRRRTPSAPPSQPSYSPTGPSGSSSGWEMHDSSSSRPTSHRPQTGLGGGPSETTTVFQPPSTTVDNGGGGGGSDLVSGIGGVPSTTPSQLFEFDDVQKPTAAAAAGQSSSSKSD